ncbi:MAG: ATP-binding protein [Metamycoplasmataceae bacterium]
MNFYNKRLIEKTIKTKFEYSGGLLIKGPKACGKTTTTKKFAKTILDLNDTSKRNFYIEQSLRNPNTLINVKEYPLLIDEWQIIPHIWDTLRAQIDNKQKEGLFLLTGSSTPSDKNSIAHSGIGRINSINMRTMSLYEFGDSNGEISLLNLFDPNFEINNLIENNKTLDDLSFVICRGGWPQLLKWNSQNVQLNYVKDYYESLIHNDAKYLNENIDFLTLDLIFKSYSRNVGSECSNNVLIEDIKNRDINKNTFSKYIRYLEDLYVIEELTSWNTKLRSKAVIRTSNTRYLIDPSLAAVSLNISPTKLKFDMNTFGLLFENLCIRDLRIYAESFGAKIYKYRDKNGLECDAIIVLEDGQWGLIEIKLSSSEQIIKTTKEKLNKLANLIDNEWWPKPAFKMILTSGNFSYKTNDDFYIISIFNLKD